MTLAIIMSHQWNDTCATKAKVCSVLAKVIKSTAVPQQKAQKGELRKPATPAQMESSSFTWFWAIPIPGGERKREEREMAHYYVHCRGCRKGTNLLLQGCKLLNHSSSWRKCTTVDLTLTKEQQQQRKLISESCCVARSNQGIISRISEK